MKGYSFSPLSTSRIEDDWDGKNAQGFFQKLGEQIARLPDGFHAQILVVREPYRGEPTHESVFDVVGFQTRFFLIETDAGHLNQFCLARIFLDLGLALTPLTSDQIEGLPNLLLGAASGPKTPDVLWEGAHIRVGENFIRVVSLTDPPSFTWPGFLQTLFESERPFVASVKISVPNKAQARRKLESKRKINHALSARRLDEIDDVTADSALESSQLTLERITIGKECMMRVSMAVFIQAKSLQMLNEECETLATQFTGDSGCGFYGEELGSLPVLKSHMPGIKPLPVREMPILSGNLIPFLPVFYDYNRSQVGNNLSVVSRCGERCHLNFFSDDNLNFNAFVCGASGSGKSFLINAVIASFLEKEANARVFVFDIGGSYKKLILSLGGTSQVLKLSTAKALIMDLLRATALAADDYTRVLIENLCGNEKNVSHSHKTAIQNICMTCAGRKFRFKDFIAEAQKKSGAAYQDLALWLEPYLGWDSLPDEGRFFGDSLTMNTAFDFKELEADPLIQKLVVLCLAKHVWDEVKASSGRPTLVVFDEVWKFFATSSVVIEEMYRTFRKYNAGIVSITQSLGDYGDSNFAKLIIANSFTRLVLQGGASSTQLAEALDLNPMAITRVLSLTSQKNRYSEFWVGTPGFSQIMRLITSEDLFQLANSEPILLFNRKVQA